MPRYHEDPNIFPMRGGCVCGLIRYTLTQCPLIVHCCHCTSCQLENGTAFALNALIESTNIQRLPSSKPMIPAGPNGIPAARPALPELSTPFESSTANDESKTNHPLPHAVIPRPKNVPGPRYITLPSESLSGQTLARCPRCFTCLWSHYGGSGPGVAFVRVGTLDEPWRVDPDVHIFTRSRRSFAIVPQRGEKKKEEGQDLPEFEAFYKDRKAVYRPESMERFRKLVPGIKAHHAALKKAKL